MTTWWCEHAWLADRPVTSVRVSADGGVVTGVEAGVAAQHGDVRLAGLVLPGFASPDTATRRGRNHQRRHGYRAPGGGLGRNHRHTDPSRRVTADAGRDDARADTTIDGHSRRTDARVHAGALAGRRRHSDAPGRFPTVMKDPRMCRWSGWSTSQVRSTRTGASA